MRLMEGSRKRLQDGLGPTSRMGLDAGWNAHPFAPFDPFAPFAIRSSLARFEPGGLVSYQFLLKTILDCWPPAT